MNILQTPDQTASGRVRSLLDVDDLSVEEVAGVLEWAADAETGGRAWTAALAGRHVALVFDKPSTRTRVSFEVAVSSMGGNALVLKGDELQLGRGETFEDTARALSCYVDAIVIRIGDHRALERFATGARVPVVNALTTMAHPCQTLADLKTIRDVFGTLTGVRAAYVGDANNVATSLMVGAALTGMHITMATPPSYAPSSGAMDRATLLARSSGAQIGVTSDPQEAVRGAHVVYTDTWTSMGFENEEHERRTIFSPFRVTSDLVSLADADAIVMHCLPAHRGEEIATEVLDGPMSVVWRQAENRLYAQMALLRLLLQAP